MTLLGSAASAQLVDDLPCSASLVAAGAVSGTLKANSATFV